MALEITGMTRSFTFKKDVYKRQALDNPEVRQASEDLAAGRKSDAVEEFLKKYEIVPRSKENQSINHQNQEERAKKTETQQQAAPETAQQPKYRYNESMILMVYTLVFFGAGNNLVFL